VAGVHVFSSKGRDRNHPAAGVFFNRVVSACLGRQKNL
jgi:hypothetical protein